jgi:membrane protein DedA with SNARE-associated domain
MHEIVSWIEHAVMAWVGGLEQSGYWGIFVLMTIESSFIPFPSEVVMLPAGVLAAQGKLSIWGSILAGTAGSLAGALFNYYFALLLGRTFLYRYGKWLLMPEDKLRMAERQWERHGEMTTFVCRLLPVIRQLISIPAGLARMNLPRFCFWTSFGAGIWVMILTVTGWLLGEAALRIWDQWKIEITVGLFLGGGALVVAWLAAKRRPARRPAPAPEESALQSDRV